VEEKTIYKAEIMQRSTSQQCISYFAFTLWQYKQQVALFDPQTAEICNSKNNEHG